MKSDQKLPKKKNIFDIIKSCEAVENNVLRCDDYSILFSMHPDHTEQHFN